MPFYFSSYSFAAIPATQVMLNALTRKSKAKPKVLVEAAEGATKEADSTVKTANTDAGADKCPSSSSSAASSGGGAACRVKHKKSHKKATLLGAASCSRAPEEEMASRTRSASSRRSCSTVVTFESIQPTQVWQASASPSPPASLKGDLAKYRRGKKGSSICAGTENLTLSMIARAAECQWISAESTGDEEDAIDTSDEWDASNSSSIRSHRHHHQHRHHRASSPSRRRPATMTNSGSLSASSDSSPTTSTSSASSLDMVGRSNDKTERYRQPPDYGPSSSSSKRCERGGKYSERGASGSSHRRKHRRSPVEPVFSAISSSSSSSSSLSDPDNESDFSWMARALKLEATAGGSLGSATPIQTPQLKRTSVNSAGSYATKQLARVPVMQISSAQQTPQLNRLPLMQLNPVSTASPMRSNSFSRPQVLPLTGFPKAQRCPTQQLPLVRRPMPKMEYLPNPLALVTESFSPTTEWMEKYKVITARQGEYLRIIPYPGTNPDLSTASTASPPASGWLLAQKWCSDHRTGTGPIGFVPRYICRLPNDQMRRTPVQEALVRLSPRRISHDTVSHHSDCTAFMTTSQQFRSDVGCAIVSESVSISEHSQLRVYPAPASVAATATGVDPNVQQANKTVFGSGASIAAAAYEIEDRDSGRGPSSGSEWSSGKGGSLSGATDLNADEKIDQPAMSSTGPSTSSPTCSSPPYPPQHWGVRSPVGDHHERRASLDHSIYGGFTCPLPPPPMVLLTDAASTTGPQKTESGFLTPNTSHVSSMSDTESPWSTTVKSKLYVRPLRTGQSLQDRTEAVGEQMSKTGDQTASKTTTEGEEDEEEGNGSPPTVVVPSNSDPTHWEPYKTMIQVGQNKLEKFTLV
nr:unnamed protein product [Spirometra erinaceieuropaei]